MTFRPEFCTALTPGNRKMRDFLIDRFSSYVDLKKSDVVEVGIGNGRFGTLLGPYVQSYSGIDNDATYLARAQKNKPLSANIDYRFGDALSMPFAFKQFDVVFYPNSFHMVGDYETAMKEATRVLKPRGIIAILDPLPKDTGWASPLLNKDSPEFDSALLALKKNHLSEARQYLAHQQDLKIVENNDSVLGTSAFWVLKPF